MLVNAVEEFIQNGSNYQLYSIKGMIIDIDVYRPLGGSSYIDLPPYIKNKQCCINLKNNDDEWFTWAVQSFIEHKNIKKNHDRPS